MANKHLTGPVTNGVLKLSQGDDGGNTYGQISVEGNATTTTFSGSSTDFSNKAQVLIFDTNSASAGTTPDHTNDHITVDLTGEYMITASISFSGAAPTPTRSRSSSTTGQPKIGPRSTRKLGTGGDVGVAAMETIGSLTASDTVELWVQNEDDTSALTVQDAAFTVTGV